MSAITKRLFGPGSLDSLLFRVGKLRDDLPRVAMFSGYGGAGKDAAGDYLVNRYGYKRLAFSDAIAEKLAQEDPLIQGEAYSSIVNRMGLTAAKKDYPGFRDAMIDVGNRLKADNPNALLDIAADKIRRSPKDKWVITGPRTPVEMTLTNEFEGATFRVSRPKVGPAISGKTGLPDPTETALNDYPFQHRIDNSGSLKNLHDRVEQAIRKRSINKSSGAHGRTATQVAPIRGSFWDYG